MRIPTRRHRVVRDGFTAGRAGFPNDAPAHLPSTLRGLRAESTFGKVPRVVSAAFIYLVVAGPVHAPRPEIRWQAPPGCPGEARVQAEIRAALADASPAVRHTIQGVVTRTGEHDWRLTLTVHGGDGVTSSTAPVMADTCEDLADEFILYTEELWRSQVVPMPAPRPRPASRLRLAAYSGVGDGVLSPGLAGGQLVYARDWRRARLEIGLSADGTVRAWRTTGDDPHQVVRVPQLIVRGCGRRTRGAFDLRLCAGISGGVFLWISAVKPTIRPTADVHLAPALTWWFHERMGFWLGLTIAVQTPPLAPLAGEGVVWKRISPGSEGFNHATWGYIAGGLGLEFRWDPPDAREKPKQPR